MTNRYTTFEVAEAVRREYKVVNHHSNKKELGRKYGIPEEIVTNIVEGGYANPIKNTRGNFKGGRIIVNGYRGILIPGHGTVRRRYALEQRVVMERVFGRKLLPNEVVHHIDFNKLNNSETNLVVLSKGSHAYAEETLYRLLKPMFIKMIKEGKILFDRNFQTYIWANEASTSQ